MTGLASQKNKKERKKEKNNNNNMSQVLDGSKLFGSVVGGDGAVKNVSGEKCLIIYTGGTFGMGLDPETKSLKPMKGALRQQVC